MHQYQGRDEEKYRKSGGKTRVKDINGKCGLKEDRTKWTISVQYHSGDPR